MKLLISTPSSLIIHENDKMTKVPQRYHENILSWKLHQILFKYLIERLQNPLNWKLRRIEIIIVNNSWSWQWKTMKILYCLIVIHLTQKLSQILKLTYWLRNKEKYLVLTHSSLIIHEQWQNLKHAR